MQILYFLIPIAVGLVAVLVAAFWWAVRSGQFDDLEGPAHSILLDDDLPQRPAEDPGADPEAARDRNQGR